jgi:hypothetical protein
VTFVANATLRHGNARSSVKVDVWHGRRFEFRVEERTAQRSSVITLAFDNLELFFVLDSTLLYVIRSTRFYVLFSTLHGILEGVCRLIQATHCTKQR